MQLVPIHEFNSCHLPGGTPTGGQFCSDRDAFVGLARPSPTARLTEPYGTLGPTVAAIRRRLMGLTASDGNEHMAVVQPDGSVRYLTSGDPKSVQVTEAIAEGLFARQPPFTSHTHPTSSAPSLQDIRMQVKYKTPKQLIVGANGDWFELEVTDFAKAEAVIGEGVRRATYWEKGTKGAFRTSFDKLRKQASNEAARATDEWAAKKFGWTIATSSSGEEGFHVELEGLRVFMSRKEAGKAHPELAAYHTERFAEQSTRIWLTLAEKHPSWLKFRYAQKKGPYASTTSAHR